MYTLFELFEKFKFFVLHLNESLGQVIATYHNWTYLILFAIIFCETGLVVTPFLPGDSLLIAAGAFAATVDPKSGATALSLHWILILLSIAAILGDAVNYAIGHFFGERLLNSKSPRLRKIFKPEYVDRTHKFYEKYGKKAIILARFVPIVRTFIPFMAGLGSMRYYEFAVYNVVGGILWVFSMTLSGYFLGTNPWIQKNFEVVVLLIIFISILPMAYEFWAHKREQARERRVNGPAVAALPEKD